MYMAHFFLIFLFCQERLSKLRAAQEKELQDPLLRAKAALEVALQDEDYERAALLYGTAKRIEQESDVLAMMQELQIQLGKNHSEKSPQQPKPQEQRQSKDPPRKVGNRPSLEFTEIATFLLDQRPRGMFGPKINAPEVPAPGHKPPSGVGRRPDPSMLNAHLHYPYNNNKPSSDDSPAP
jgi:hypothetical protein